MMNALMFAFRIALDVVLVVGLLSCAARVYQWCRHTTWGNLNQCCRARLATGIAVVAAIFVMAAGMPGDINTLWEFVRFAVYACVAIAGACELYNYRQPLIDAVKQRFDVEE